MPRQIQQYLILQKVSTSGRVIKPPELLNLFNQAVYEFDSCIPVNLEEGEVCRLISRARQAVIPFFENDAFLPDSYWRKGTRISLSKNESFVIQVSSLKRKPSCNVQL